MGLNLCLDIGNTSSKIAIFEGNEMVFFERVKRIFVKKIKEIHTKYRFRKVIYSATGRIPPTVLRHLEENYHLIELNHNTSIPIDNQYKTPETLGRDRIAGIVGAFSLYPNQNNLVIDIGTCITYDFINSDNIYLGGNIAPGVDIKLKAMNRYTKKLPLVEKEKNDHILGISTKTALQNGSVWGTYCEIESFIRLLQDTYKEINVILTGGDASFFAEMIKTKIFVHPNLVLCGLNKILAFNAE
jgi:type III pantothenate kinase